MVEVARLYTPAEAGAVSGLKLKAVHNAIDKHIVEPEGALGACLQGGLGRPSLPDGRGSGAPAGLARRR